MSLTQTQKLLTILSAVAVLVMGIVAMMPGRAAASTYVTLYQQLRPQACTPSASSASDGTISLTVATGCGQLVLPGERGGTVTAGSGGSIVIPVDETGQAPLDIFFSSKPVYLESDLARQPKRGYMLLTELYARYTFYLTGDNHDTQPRSMEIVGVGSDVVLVQFWPGMQRYALHVGQRVDVDVNGDGEPDIALRVQQIGSNGAVLLHVAFPEQPSSAFSTVREDRFAFLASVTTFAGLALIIYNYVHNIYLRKHALPPKEWWSVHHHTPFI